MAVVQSLGTTQRGMRASAKRGRGICSLAAVTVLAIVAPIVRADVAGEWVAPASLDEVPVRAVGVEPEAVAPTPAPIVVPLPTGLETGAAVLGTLAVARWWTRRRRA